jgi:hypothetical protein
MNKISGIFFFFCDFVMRLVGTGANKAFDQEK